MSSASPAAYSNPAGGSPLSPLRRRSRSRYAALSTAQSVYDWIVLALVALAPWVGVWLFGAVRWWSIGPLMGLIFLATALCALRYWFERDGLTRRFPPGFIALAVFVFYAFLLIPRAAVPYDAHMECLKLASLWCAYGVWSELSGWQGRWRWLVAGFLLVVTVMAWYAIIQHTQGSRDVLNLVRPKDYAMRASGAYFCPNHFANLLDMTVPFALAIAASPAAGLPLRLLAGYSVLVALPPLYLTQSRSGWIGMLLGSVTVIALLGLRRSVRRFLLLLLVAPVVLGAAGALVWMWSPMVQERVAQALQGNIRIQIWMDTWLMIQDRFWLGWGAQSYRWVYPHYWIHMNSFLDPEYAHNDFIQAWAEYGLVGLLLLVAAGLVVVVRLLRQVRRTESDRTATLIIAFLGALVAMAAHACFDYNFHIYGNASVLVMMAGLAAGSLGQAVALPPSESAPPRPRWFALTGAAVAVVALLVTARGITAYGLSLKADFDAADFKMEEAEAGYQRALRLEPRYWQAYIGLGHLYAGQAFWNRDPETKAQQIGKAEQAYQAALAINPWEGSAAFGLSRLYNLKGQPEEALRILQGVVEKMPYHRDYLNQLGLQLRQMGRLAEALEVFKRARSFGLNEMADLNIQSITRKLAQQTAPPVP